MSDTRPSDTDERTAHDQPELPDVDDAIRTHQGCPNCDDPADDDHNCLTVQKVTIEDGDLKLLLYLKCTCGHERRRTIG